MLAHRIARAREVREQRHEAPHAVAHRVDEEQHDLVAAELRQGDVEVEVELEQLDRVRDLVRAIGERLELRDTLAITGGPRRAEPRDLAPEDPPEFEEIADQLGLAARERQQVLDQLDPSGLHEVLDPGAVALADADEPEVLELLQRLAEGRTVDPQALRQLSLRRELRARRILSVEDERAQLLGNLLGHALLLDRLEHPLERG